MNELLIGKLCGHSPFLSLLLNIVVYLENSSIKAVINKSKVFKNEVSFLQYLR